MFVAIQKELSSLKMDPFNMKKKRLRFEDIQTTGDDHWTHSSGTTPKSLEAEHKNEDIEEEDNYGNEGSDKCEEVSPPSAKRKVSCSSILKGQGKETKDL
jgi:hypothetical protein